MHFGIHSLAIQSARHANSFERSSKFQPRATRTTSETKRNEGLYPGTTSSLITLTFFGENDVIFMPFSSLKLPIL